MCVKPPQVVLSLLEDAGISLPESDAGFFSVCGSCNDDGEWEPVLDDVEYEDEYEDEFDF